METTPLRSKILDTIIRKSTLKQRIFDNTFSAFNELKETLLEMASELDDELDDKLDRRVRLEYRDRGKFEAQLQVANDILIFQMHTDIFEFAADHPIWQNPYVQDDRENSYCGLINIYNFLSDSFSSTATPTKATSSAASSSTANAATSSRANSRPRCGPRSSAKARSAVTRSSPSSKRRSGSP